MKVSTENLKKKADASITPFQAAEAKARQRLGGVNTHGHRHEHKDLQVSPLSGEPVNEESTSFDDQPIASIMPPSALKPRNLN